MAIDRRTDVKFRTAYGPRFRVRFKTVGKTMAKQSFANECDINNILKRFGKSGQIDHLAAKPPEYGVVEGSDLHTLMNVVAEANSAYEVLPDSLRDRFSSPHELVSFLGDEANRAEAIDLGLVEPLIPGLPVEVRVVPDSAGEDDLGASGDEPEPPAHIPT